MINSIADLATALKALGEPKEGYTRFFRGHSNSSYELVPSIYRKDKEGKSLIHSEDKIIKDAFTYCSDSFLPNETLFERLTKLQHYNYKTRLLDVSSNALVGLYFAVASSKEQEVANGTENGEIIVLDIPNCEIKYDDSDLVSILSAISLRNHRFSIDAELKNIGSKKFLHMIYFAKNIMEKRQLFEKTFNEEDKENVNNALNQLGMKMDDVINQELNDELATYNHKLFHKQPEIERLLHDIRKDKPSFLPIINPDDFNRVVCVRAKANTPRIAKQQGSFLLFGITKVKTECAKIPDNWQKTLNGNKFLISSKAKESILEELKSFGISHQSLFPELDSQANDIMNKYK